MPGAHKIGAAISGPRIAGGNFMDITLFLTCGVLAVVLVVPYMSVVVVVAPHLLVGKTFLRFCLV